MTQILLLWTSAGLKRIKAQLLDLDRVSSSPALTPVTVDATIVRLRINMDLRDQRLSLLKVFTINRHSLSFICLYCEMIFMNILFQGFRELLCTHLLGLWRDVEHWSSSSSSSSSLCLWSELLHYKVISQVNTNTGFVKLIVKCYMLLTVQYFVTQFPGRKGETVELKLSDKIRQVW